MILTILKIIGSSVLILMGLVWIFLSILSACMADRSINPLTEMYLPASIGLIPIIIGFVILWNIVSHMIFCISIVLFLSIFIFLFVKGI